MSLLSFKGIQDTATIGQNERFQKWFQKCERNGFVAHGIRNLNVQKCFDDGHVRCGADIFMKTMTLEFEGGSVVNAREIISFSKEQLDPDHLLSHYFNCILKGYKEIFDEMIEYIPQWLQNCNEKEKKYINHKLKRSKRLKIKPIIPPPSPESSNLRDVGAWSYDLFENFNEYFRYISLKNDPPGKIRDIYKKPIVALALNSCLPDKYKYFTLVEKIKTVYETTILGQNCFINEKKLDNLIYSVVKCILLDPVKIQLSISVIPNSTVKCYGEVRVLSKKWEAKTLGETDDETGEVRLPMLNEKLNAFTTIDLADPTTIIVGPKAILSKLAIRSEAIRQNIVFNESLSTEQKNLLGS